MAAPTRNNAPFDISLGLEGTHILVTGGCGLIGRVVVQAFLAAGCNVTALDLLDVHKAATVLDLSGGEPPNPTYFTASVTDGKSLDDAFASATDRFGPVECCVALAGLDLSVLTQCDSICDVDPKEWRKVFDVNIHGTFLTCQRWLQGIRAASQDPGTASKLKNVGLVIMGSESGTFGVRTMAAYAAGKSAVQYGLLQSLAKDAPRIYSKARVNAVAPGAVDTDRFKDECERYGEQWRYEECEATVGLAKPVPPEDVARTILFLASERFSGSVHGQLIPVDGGKTGSVCWTREELAERRRR
ncbi:hypothetical protein LTR36_004406 [Oleoguttula mirabilis]|uniref:NAD(P)-binding protein n=1 Tax=Oleoguttula mirabilis TaxID=1507867 RepID=A0AAV9JGY5_9PEZI|nr:hypothetical protein LTR36_004406 [Oleoguttula mirabilis]